MSLQPLRHKPSDAYDWAPKEGKQIFVKGMSVNKAPGLVGKRRTVIGCLRKTESGNKKKGSTGKCRLEP